MDNLRLFAQASVIGKHNCCQQNLNPVNNITHSKFIVSGLGGEISDWSGCSRERKSGLALNGFYFALDFFSPVCGYTTALVKVFLIVLRVFSISYEFTIMTLYPGPEITDVV